MGFFKKLLSEAGDSIKKSVEERKQEIRQNFEDRKKEALAKMGLISETNQTSEPETHNKIPSEGLPSRNNELKDFKRKKMDDLREVRDEKDRNRTPDNINKWKQVMADIEVIDTALRAGATTLGELKELAKDNASLIAEIDDFLVKPIPQSVSINNIEPQPVNIKKKDVEVKDDDISGLIKKESEWQIVEEGWAKELSLPLTSDGSVFSARLEALISSALQDGVLTEQEKAILKKRAEAEGEDWSEVEMIINARLAERQPMPQVENDVKINAASQNNQQNSSTSVQQPKCSDDSKTTNDELENINKSQYLIINGTVYKEFSASRIDKDIISRVSGLNNSYIISVTIPTCVKTIIKDAFRSCRGLTSITFSNNSVKNIGDNAFRGCSGLTSVTIPDSVISIGESAFSGCTGLTSVAVGNSVTSIGESAFSGCTGLTSVTLNSKVVSKSYRESYNMKFIFGNQVTEYNIGDGVTRIGDYAFSGCTGLTSVTIPNSVTSIGEYAFNKCKKLKTIILPSSLKNISDFAFLECDNLKQVDFSRCVNLEKIVSNSFKWCRNLQILDFSKCNKLWDINYVMIYQKGLSSLNKIILPPSQTEFNALCVWTSNVHIGEEASQVEIDITHCNNFKIVEKEAFQTMDMKEIIIPDTVESIGENAFDECENLKTIVMPAGLKEIKGSLGGHMEQLKKVDFSKVTQLRTIPKELFSLGCDKLKELIIPNGVTEIEDDALLQLTNLKNLFLPPSLTTMGDFDRYSDSPSYKINVYCYSPNLEELEPLVFGWDDDDDDEKDLSEKDIRELGLESGGKNKIKTTLYVLPQFFDNYIAQRKAERIPEDVLIIQEIPEEYRYYYDV